MTKEEKQLQDYRNILFKLKNISKNNHLIIKKENFQELLINAVCLTMANLNSIIESNQYKSYCTKCGDEVLGDENGICSRCV